MKIFLIISIMLSAALTSADQMSPSSPRCLSQANGLVMDLENLWVDMMGPFQGDYDKHQLDYKISEATSSDITFEISAAHTNEDGEDWYNTYTVKLSGEACYLENYSFLGAKASPVVCIDKKQAQKVLNKVLEPLVGSVPIDWFFWLDENEEDQIFISVLQDTALNTLKWNDEYQEFSTDVLYSGACAAGADCWGGFRVNCEGDVDVWFEGEE